MLAPSLKRLATALALACAPFLILEAALRHAGFEHDVVEVPIAVWTPDGDRAMADETFVIRPEVRQLWGPRPGARVTRASEERINAAGWRGPLVPEGPHPGVLRIATMGDSSTFGLHVGYEETFSAQLEDLLRDAGVNAEVLDFGVTGSTIQAGAERYRELVRAYRPDVVVLGYGAINEHFAAFVSDAFRIRRNVKRDRLGWRVVRKLRTSLRVLHLGAYWVDRVQDKQRTVEAMIVAEGTRQTKNGADPRQADWEGVRRVSLTDFEALLERLIRDVRRDGARPVLLSMPRTAAKEREVPILPLYTATLERTAAAHRVPLIDVRGAFRSRVANGTEEAELFIDRDPVHPSPLGHGVIANLLFETWQALDDTSLPTD